MMTKAAIITELPPDVKAKYKEICKISGYSMSGLLLNYINHVVEAHKSIRLGDLAMKVTEPGFVAFTQQQSNQEAQ